MKSGWQEKPLAQVLRKTETINPLLTPETEFEYIDVSSVSNQTFQIEQTQRLKGKDAPSRARRVVKANDVIFATVRPTLQRIAVVPESFDNQVCSTGYIVLRPKPEINYRYLFYYLFTDRFMSQMAALQKGASYPAVTDGDVQSQLIPFPPLPEQQRIVAILDQAFDAIARARAIAAQNLINAQCIFESELQVIFARSTGEWQSKRLGDICLTIQDGAHESPKNQFNAPGNSRFPYITSKNIRTNYMDLSDISYVERDFHDRIYPRCKPSLGDVLLTKDGANTGNVTLNTLDEPFSLLSSVCLIKTNPKLLLPAFLCYYLQSPEGLKSITGQMTGAAIKRIILRDIKLAIIPVPSLIEQQEVVLKLNNLLIETERLQSIYQRKLASLDELKSSLLRQAFTGQL